MVRPSQLTPMQRLLLAISLPITLVFLYFLFRKNDDEDDEEADARVVASRQTTIEVKVPKDAVGAVIGVQGAQIKLIKSITKARLNFKDKDSTNSDKDCVLVIQGTQEGAQKAELMVRQIIVDQPELVTEVVRVPQTSVGRIIGRNGETIRSISHQSKAKVVIERTESRDQFGMVEIQVKGTAIAVDCAKMLILEKVEEDQKSRKRMAASAQKQKQTDPVRGGVADWNFENSRGERDVYSEVYVSAVEHPGHFWVQFLNKDSPKLDQMEVEMTAFYGELDQPQGETVEPVVGSLVAAPFPEDNAWYRARVLDVVGDEVDLYFVDFGDSLFVSKKKKVPTATLR